MKKLSFILLLLLLSRISHARHSYYPQEYQEMFYAGQLYDEQLKGILFHILNAPHQLNDQGTDTLNCPDAKKPCYGHLDLGYHEARRVLFGELHLKKDDQGFYIQDVYCRKMITERESQIGYRVIPNHQVINCEHTWPQSRFSSRFSLTQQKSDLHHLYPTDPRANSIRGHSEFTNIDYNSPVQDCVASKTEGAGGRFEPPHEHKGNVARALFYFSVRYKLKIGAEEEAVLRMWHILDPVDAEEMWRNDRVYQAQQNRNPFIDWPELVDYIGDF